MKLINRIFLLLALIFLTGCTVLTPKTYQLEQIHQNYTTEWAEFVSGLPPAGLHPQAADGKGQFTKTLTGIRNYKKEHGDNSKVAAHLTVLEGMIYLQTGKPGMAKLLATEVKTAKDKLKSPTGIVARDYLFAECYENLVQGWEAIFRINDGKSVPAEDFIGPAENIKDKLDRLPKDNRDAIDVDSGGAYVATSAAIFYIWATFVDGEKFILKNMAKNGKDVLKSWLTKDERCSAEKKDKAFNNPEYDWGSRLRYLEWYNFLHFKTTENPTAESCCQSLDSSD